MHPTVADVASPFLPSIRHAKSAPPCKAKTLANAQVFRASTAEIYPLNFTKTLNLGRVLINSVGHECPQRISDFDSDPAPMAQKCYNPTFSTGTAETVAGQSKKSKKVLPVPFI